MKYGTIRSYCNFLLASAVMSIAGPVWADETPIASTYSIPGERVFPESVDVDPASGLVFTASAETGALYRGRIDENEFVLVAPAGSNSVGGFGVRVLSSGDVAVAGGASGIVNIFTPDGILRRSLTVESIEGVFLNDLVELPDGRIFVTDSFRPVLYVWQGQDENRLAVWLDLAEAGIRYQDGFNLNGIAADANVRALVVAQTNTRQFWRIDLNNQSVSEISVGSGRGGGDGLRLVGNRLFAIQEDRVSIFDLSANLTDAKLVGDIRNAFFDGPTGIAVHADEVFVTNAQFARQADAPSLPFTVVRTPIPAAFSQSKKQGDQ